MKPTDESIDDVLKLVHKGKLVIPNFQRDFTWTTPQVKELLESVLQSYYIGSILVWKCKNRKQAKLDMKPVYGVPLSKDDLDPEGIILDGQQRLTSLYYAKFAPDLPLKWTKYPYAFFVKVEKILSDDLTDCVYADAKGTSFVRKLLSDKESQFKNKLFPICEIDNLHNWLDNFEEYLEKVENKSRDEARSIKYKLRDALSILEKEYRIAIIELPEEMSIDHVCTVFEKLNSTGTTLTVFDLLNARLLKYNLDLRGKLWHAVREAENSLTNKFCENNSRFQILFLQFISLLRKGSCKRKELIKLSHHGLVKDWNIATESIEKALKAITNYRKSTSSYGVLSPKQLPYQPMIPLLALLFHLSENKKNMPLYHEKISRWYWSAIFRQAYSGSTDTQLAKDLRQIKLWFKKDTELPEVVDTSKPIDLNLVDETRMSSAIYRGILSLIVLRGAKDFIRDEPPEYNQLHDHHIFPQNKAGKLKLKKKEHINSILNRTLISADSNLKNFMKDAPSKYVKAIEKEMGRDALLRNLKTHFINEKCYECLLQDDFYGFIGERENLIQKEIKKVTGSSTSNAVRKKG